MSALVRLPSWPAVDDAEFSGDGLHRLWLSRRVADDGPVGVVLGLNPSKADAKTDDHTITKLRVFTKRWGWSGFWMINLFTCIETHSWKLKQRHPRGDLLHEHAESVLRHALPNTRAIVVCWGAAVPQHAAWRVGEVCSLIRDLRLSTTPVRCFGVTKDGSPVHPLRLAYSTPMVMFELPAERPSRRDE